MTNEDIAKEVSDTQALWSGVRRAEVIQQVRRLIREKGLTHKDLAIRMGVHGGSVSRILRGRQNIEIDALYSLADALQVPLSITFDAPESPEVAYQEGREDALFELSKRVAAMNPDKLLEAIKRTIKGDE